MRGWHAPQACTQLHKATHTFSVILAPMVFLNDGPKYWGSRSTFCSISMWKNILPSALGAVRQVQWQRHSAAARLRLVPLLKPVQSLEAPDYI